MSESVQSIQLNLSVSSPAVCLHSQRSTQTALHSHMKPQVRESYHHGETGRSLRA